MELAVAASLSDHNDEQDGADEALWTDLQERVKAIIADPRYEAIEPIAIRF